MAEPSSTSGVATHDPAQDQAQALGIDAMLALLAAESDKPLSGLAGRFDSRAARVALFGGGFVVFSGLLLLVMMVMGSLL